MQCPVHRDRDFKEGLININVTLMINLNIQIRNFQLITPVLLKKRIFLTHLNMWMCSDNLNGKE